MCFCPNSFQFKKDFNPIVRNRRPTCQYRNWNVLTEIQDEGGEAGLPSLELSDFFDRPLSLNAVNPIKKEYRCLESNTNIMNSEETDAILEICNEFNKDWVCLTKNQLERVKRNETAYKLKVWEDLPDKNDNRHPYLRLWDFKVRHMQLLPREMLTLSVRSASNAWIWRGKQGPKY